MSYETILFEQSGHVATITLNRPHRMNSISYKMQGEMKDAWTKVRDDDSIWVANLTGAGDRAFCAGADIKEIHGDKSVLPKSVHEVTLTARDNYVYKPVICAVNGICVGGGLRFVAHSDIVLAAEGVEFMDTHTTVGLVAGFDIMALTRKMPFHGLMQLALLGNTERMSAERARQLCLVQEVAPKAKLMERARELADHICENAPLAVQRSIEALWLSAETGMHSALDIGFRVVQHNFHTEDFKEGPRAFAEKRKPLWKAK